MANIKSAKKRILIAKRNAERNRKVKDQIRDIVKNIGKKYSKKEDIRELLTLAVKNIDSAVSKGVFHWKAAARKKSRLVKRFSKTA